ncbi:MAG: hypothetical protein NTV29_10290 [Planctomycetota bacterium]|nr:hypothetical protein [Planctomycetota bacterium]
MDRFARFTLPESFRNAVPEPSDVVPEGSGFDRAEYLARIEFALELAGIASEVTLKFFRTSAYQVERKSDRSPVTAADKGAEQAVRESIAKRYPKDSLLGEEFGSIVGTNDFEWIIDPIDGTKSFISGVPLYSTLVGLTCRGQPLLGVIAIPALGELVLVELGTDREEPSRDLMIRWSWSGVGSQASRRSAMDCF